MEVNWNVITGEIVTATLKILLPVIVALIFKWATELWLRIKENEPNVASVLEYTTRTAIFAAEQIFGSGHGEQKKDYAIAYINKFLADQGISVDSEIIINTIESAVWEHLNQYKESYDQEWYDDGDDDE